MYEFLATASELLFNDANVLLKLREWFFSQAGNILLALIIFFVGRYIIRWIKNVAVRVMTRANYDTAAMGFVSQIINYVLLVGFLGIGLALQNNMSNLASGLLILIFKPFRAGHYIEVGDITGSVTSIQFMNTIVTTRDQKRVYIPNSILTSQSVTNYSYMTERMIPFVFDIGYNNEHHKAIRILKDVFDKDKRILNAKYMEIGISEFGDNSVRISAFAEVKTSQFLEVRYSIMSDVKDAFDKHGIDIPYPQRVVYIQHADTSTDESKETKKKVTTTNQEI